MVTPSVKDNENIHDNNITQ